MTLEKFDKMIGYLIELVLPPSATDEPAANEVFVLDVLEKHCEVLRGRIISLKRMGCVDPRARVADEIDHELR